MRHREPIPLLIPCYYGVWIDCFAPGTIIRIAAALGHFYADLMSLLIMAAKRS